MNKRLKKAVNGTPGELTDGARAIAVACVCMCAYEGVKADARKAALQ